jgi:hypothetical protein
VAAALSAVSSGNGVARHLAGRPSKPLRYFKPSSKSTAVFTEPVPGMVYKWAALTDARGASVSKGIGCQCRGSNGWT